MSHTTEVKAVPITDLNALNAAVERLKGRGVRCDLVKDAKPRMYFRHQEVKCDYVLKLHNSEYDIGFQKASDGSYTPIYDEYANHVGRELAVKAEACPVVTTPQDKALRQIGMFTQEYARCVAVNEAAAAGYYVESESIDREGAYQLQFASYSDT